MFDTDGKLTGILGIGRDITERKQFEMQLSLQSLVLNQIQDRVLITDLEGVITYVNDAAIRALGFSRDELIGVSVEKYGEAPDRGATQKEIVKETLEHGQWRGEVVNRTAKGEEIILDCRTQLVLDEQGNKVALAVIVTDITAHKLAEAGLEKRLMALTQPLANPEGIDFEALFVPAEIQRLQDEFALATGVASIITRPDGTPLTVPSNFCRLCKDLIRKTEMGLANCFKSDVALGRPSHDGPTIQPCLSGGLWDAGAAISVGGHHVANWLIGQVRDAEQTEEKMRAYARNIGADETAVAEAFHAVPAMSYERFEKIARVLFTLANQLSATAYQNVQQARFITERKRAEEELGESEERFKALHNASFGGIAIHDQGVILECNQGLSEISGFGYDELVGMDGLLLIAEQSRESVMTNIRSGYEKPYEAFGVRKNGEVYPLRLEARNIPYKGTMGRVVEFRDITEPKKAEELLRESELTFRKLFEDSADAIQLLDKTGVFVECNQAALTLLKMTREQFLFKPPVDLSPEYQPDGQSSREKALKMIEIAYEKSLHRFDWTLINSEGIEFIVEVSLMPIKVKGELMLYSSWRDITERKRAEAERESLQVQLIQAQKMESVGRLAGGVAHDFNNMLGVIIGLADIILMQMAPDNPFHADLTEIRKAGERSADLTRQLLTFARKQTVAPKVLDFNDTIENMLKLLRRLIGEDIDLLWKPGHGLWPVKMDPTQIDQILANLCVNARDAIDGVGKVTIETDKASFDEEYCSQHMDFVPGDYVLLAVSDNGCGMDIETTSHLFEPFFTTKEMGKGTGLGLATVYGAVKQNNGFINVYSEPGQGTTFKIYLPCHAAKAGTETKEPTPQDTERGSETILLVEDEPAILRMTTMMLELLGYTVVAASTPGEALRLAQEHPGCIDLVLTDVVMPEMNGRDLAKNLLSIYPDMRRLFMSGYTANVIAHQGVLDEGVHFMQKPFSLGDLKVKLREALAG
jgi:PAS domain S-box-containing protein